MTPAQQAREIADGSWSLYDHERERLFHAIRSALTNTIEGAAKIADDQWSAVKLGDGEIGAGKMVAARSIATAIRALKGEGN